MRRVLPVSRILQDVSYLLNDEYGDPLKDGYILHDPHNERMERDKRMCLGCRVDLLT